MRTGITCAVAGALGLLLMGCKADFAVEVSVGDTLTLEGFSPQITGVVLRREDGEVVRLSDDRLRQIDWLDGNAAEVRVLIDSIEIGAGTYTGIALSVSGSGGTVRFDDDTRTRTLAPVDGLFAPIDLRISDDSEARVHVVLEPHFSVTDPRVGSGAENARFRPVVRAVVDDGGRGVEGRVRTGLVEGRECRDASAPAQGAAIYAFDAAHGFVADHAESNTVNPLAVAVVSHDSANGYRYRFRALPEGRYTLALLCTADEDRPDLLQNLSFLRLRDLTLGGENAVVDFDD